MLQVVYRMSGRCEMSSHKTPVPFKPLAALEPQALRPSMVDVKPRCFHFRIYLLWNFPPVS